MPNALSIHIGLNDVDPVAYGGGVASLMNCVNDANSLQVLASGLGYRTQSLINSGAHAAAVAAAISDAARQLVAGDILLITYSGHGSQVPDANGGDEPDAQDETWVLWDRMLIDDELYALWSQFAAGVRILVISDSCHSGTILRVVASAGGPPDVLIEEGPKVREHRLISAALRASNDPEIRGRSGLGPGSRSAAEPKTRNLSLEAQIASVRNCSREYAVAQLVAGPSSRASIRASVILLSGCQDNQLSSDGSGSNGLFTGTLLTTWNQGAFTGDYTAFHRAICHQMPVNQTPNLMMLGENTDAFAAQTPFAVAAPGAGAGAALPAPTATAPATQPTTTQPAAQPFAARPVLRRGDTGTAVAELQQLLNDRSYGLDVDGDFGWATHGAVVDFQTRNQLAADGVVGPQTWSALLSDPATKSLSPQGDKRAAAGHARSWSDTTVAHP